MMNTILNLSLNDKTTTEGLAKKEDSNPQFAYDCYRRFIQMFGGVSLGIEMESSTHLRRTESQNQSRSWTQISRQTIFQAIIADYKLVRRPRKSSRRTLQRLLMSRDAC